MYPAAERRQWVQSEMKRGDHVLVEFGAVQARFEAGTVRYFAPQADAEWCTLERVLKNGNLVVRTLREPVEFEVMPEEITEYRAKE